MKKKILIRTALLAMTITVTFALTACGSKVPESLTGSWQCDKYSSGNPIDTSFYSMSIKSDGTFSLDNSKTGKADLAGTMEGDDTGKLGILELNCDKAFNPPKCWSTMKKTSSVRYKIIDNKTMKLGYVGIWMTFHKK